MGRPQEALLHGPGPHAAVTVWRDRGVVPSRILRERAFELAGLVSVRVLIALDVALLDADERAAVPALEVLPRRQDRVHMPSTQGSLLLQLSSSDRDELLVALRRADRLLGRVADRTEEVIGGWPASRREPFGFRELGPVDPRGTAVIDEGPLAGGTFVLYQRYVQDCARFEALRASAQERVIGKTIDGELLPGAPPASHAARMRAGAAPSAIVRRGFPYRAHGDEGLAYVALARAPSAFRDLLDAMLGRADGARDTLLDYVQAISGGAYFAPATR